MHRPQLALLTMAILAGALFSSSPTMAHDDKRSHSRDRYDSHWDDNDRPDRYDRRPDNRWDRNDDYNDRYRGDTFVRINLSPWDKRNVSERIEKEYWQKCRTVAGQRYYGCGNSGHGMPYRIGSKLPPHAVAWNVPRSVTPYLPRANHGTRYVWVDRDILLISLSSGVVLDAVRVR